MFLEYAAENEQEIQFFLQTVAALPSSPLVTASSSSQTCPGCKSRQSSSVIVDQNNHGDQQNQQYPALVLGALVFL